MHVGRASTYKVVLLLTAAGRVPSCRRVLKPEWDLWCPVSQRAVGQELETACPASSNVIWFCDVYWACRAARRMLEKSAIDVEEEERAVGVLLAFIFCA
jgi:hypothetical protein